MRTFNISAVVLAAAALTFTGSTPALAEYPDKPIKFIIPFGAGGNFDALARKIGQYWEKDLGVSIVYQSLPGSGGRRGGIRIFKSKPDGYTVGWTHFTPLLADKYLRGKKPAIDVDKVKIVYQISQGQQYIFVAKNGPYHSLADLKKAGRPIKFASTGVGAITWVQAKALAATVGFETSFVLGYKKLTDAAIAVAKGDAEAGVGGARHFRPVKDDLRPLMFFGPKRDRFYPKVPSAGGLGYNKITNLGAPRVITAPPGTPEGRLKILRAATKKVLADPAFVKWATETGFYLDAKGPKGTREGLKDKGNIFKELRPLVIKSKS